MYHNCRFLVVVFFSCCRCCFVVVVYFSLSFGGDCNQMKISWIPKFSLWWYLFILVIQLKIYWMDDMKMKSSIYIQVYVWITNGITNAVAMHPTCSTTWWLYSTNQVHDDFSLTRQFILRHGVGHMEFPVLWASLVSQVGASPYRVNLTAPVRLGQNCPRKLAVTMTMN